MMIAGTPLARVFEATVALAREHFHAGRLVDAETVCRRALTLAPGHAETLNMLGVVIAERGNPLLALKFIDQALQAAPATASFHTNRGEILRRWGLIEEGLESCRRAAELAPASADARNNLGAALLDLGRTVEAVPHFVAARQANPAMTQACFNHGRALKALGDWTGSMEAQRAAIAANPAYAEAWYELACVLERVGDLQAAAEACHRAVALKPVFPEAWIEAGDIATNAGDLQAAVSAYRRAVELAPDSAIANYQLAICLLGLEQFEEGWRLYEARQAPSPTPVEPPPLPMPMWRGEPMAGRKLLVLTEQGFGDHIQFSRLIPQLARSGIEVVVGASPEVAPLMHGLPGVTRVITQIEDCWTSGCDRWVFVCSLAMHLGVRAGSIPAEVPYLAAEPDKVAAWRARLAALGPGRKVGLVWAGRSTHANDWRRSIRFADLAPLAEVPGVRFIGLQLGERAADAGATGGGLDVTAVGHELADFGDTAALLSALDLLVSIDSAPVHLAGALARPVWTLLPFQPDWRWRPDHERSRWYPTMRLFRQAQQSDWSEVIARVRDELHAWAAATVD